MGIPKSRFEISGLGSTGDSPVPPGDPPDGMERPSKRGIDVDFIANGFSVPFGGSPTGAGEWPAPPFFKQAPDGE